ncbi:phosphatidylglycerol lysyltransferase domain-containing protein [Octadecabacter sp.]|nr:phosphatidylglycerol lysyltransferase domain-containing protein [Octadecabacter sp.]
MSFHLLFAAYLIALGAGLLSNAPSGIGAFDLTLLALLGATTDAQAMAAVLAFRVIYYAIPTAVALLGLWHTRPLLRAQAPNHPEAALVFQSAIPFAHSKGNMLTLPCWRNGAILGDLPDAMTLKELRRQTDLKALYKCGAKQAIAARTAGWLVIRCAQDALIFPQQWSTNRPDTRQLRRALTAFERSNITLREVTDPEILRPVATQWAASHGGEEGHSMGQFCSTYLRQQRVFAAFDQDTPVAFASFHTGPVWTLDLMRHTANIPKGTMHALVQAAIHSARDTGVQTLSLASVAAPPRNFPFGAKITARCAGLKRFKSSFAPSGTPAICARAARSIF